MAAPVAEVRGLREFRRDLKALDGNWPKELAREHRKIAKTVETKARGIAGRLSRQQAAAAGAIKGVGTQGKASIGVSATAGAPWARAAFWGGQYPSGWYADEKYGGPNRTEPPESSQFPPWVTNNWEAGTFGEGPYAIGPAVAGSKRQIYADYLAMVDRISDRAFNN